MRRAGGTHGKGEKFIQKLVGKPNGKRLPRRPRRIWEDNIRIDLREIGWKGIGQDRDKWRAVVNTVMSFRVP